MIEQDRYADDRTGLERKMVSIRTKTGEICLLSVKRKTHNPYVLRFTLFQSV